MRRLVLAILMVSFLFIGLFIFSNKQNLEISSTYLQVEIADQEKEHFQGLSGRNYLCGNCAMLFIFKEKKIRSFVMRDMMMPIDIIFIQDGVVIDIYRDLQAESYNYKHYYPSSKPINMALELNANLSDKYGIEVGDKIRIN